MYAVPQVKREYHYKDRLVTLDAVNKIIEEYDFILVKSILILKGILLNGPSRYMKSFKMTVIGISKVSAGFGVRKGLFGWTGLSISNQQLSILMNNLCLNIQGKMIQIKTHTFS